MGNSYDAEFEKRKLAIQRFLKSGTTQQEIYQGLSKSRSWFEYWFRQYQKAGLEGLRSRTRGWQPGTLRKYSSRLIDEIVAIRKRLEDDHQEYYYGAERIIQEFLALGYNKDKLPSIVYIKKVLSQRGCVKETRLKDYIPLRGYPESFLASLGLLCQIDFIGYKRIHNSNNPIHFLAVAYRELKYGSIWRILAEKSGIIVPLLFDYWQENPTPNVVQMDNDWAFAGSAQRKVPSPTCAVFFWP